MRILSLAVCLVAVVHPVCVAYANPDTGMIVNVRAGIDDREKARRDKEPAYARDPGQHARRFFLAKVSEEKSELKLVKPVDAKALAKQVRDHLAAQGFHAVTANEKPDFIITVKYGRGYPFNPYTDSDTDKQITNLSNSDRVQVWRTHDKYVGLEHRRQQAGQEHLLIQIRAWQYPPPPDPKKREKLLWATTIMADDPEHRDLNEISEKMLTIGAPYFDQHIDREHEISVNTALPEGHVNVGSPEVVSPNKRN